MLLYHININILILLLIIICLLNLGKGNNVVNDDNNNNHNIEISLVEQAQIGNFKTKCRTHVVRMQIQTWIFSLLDVLVIYERK